MFPRCGGRVAPSISSYPSNDTTLLSLCTARNGDYPLSDCHINKASGSLHNQKSEVSRASQIYPLVGKNCGLGCTSARQRYSTSGSTSGELWISSCRMMQTSRSGLYIRRAMHHLVSSGSASCCRHSMIA